MIVLLASVAHASQLAVDVSSGNSVYNSTLGDAGTLGWEFSVTANANINVTGLGIWQYNCCGLAASVSHEVAIWALSVSGIAFGTEVADATVVPDTATPVASNGNGEWLFTSLSELVPLDPGTYVIGAYYPLVNSGGTDPVDFGSNPVSAPELTSSSGIQYLQERDDGFGNADALAMPTVTTNSGGGFGPDFTFITPEPSPFALFALAGAISAAARMRKTRAA